LFCLRSCDESSQTRSLRPNLRLYTGQVNRDSTCGHADRCCFSNNSERFQKVKTDPRGFEVFQGKMNGKKVSLVKSAAF